MKLTHLDSQFFFSIPTTLLIGMEGLGLTVCALLKRMIFLH